MKRILFLVLLMIALISVTSAETKLSREKIKAIELARTIEHPQCIFTARDQFCPSPIRRPIPKELAGGKRRVREVICDTSQLAWYL